MVDLVPPASGWRPPVVATSALEGLGVAELWAAVERHRAWAAENGRGPARRRARLAAELRWLVAGRAGAEGVRLCRGTRFTEAVAALADGRVDPRSAAQTILSS